MSIQVQHLRDWIGEHSSTWSHLLPLVEDGMYHLPSGSLLDIRMKNKRIRPQPWEDNVFFNDHQLGSLRVLLTRDIGMSPRTVAALTSRKIIHFKRIEEFIAGLIDSLFVANIHFFTTGSADLKVIRGIVRKIFYVGTYNLGELHTMWKEWTNWFTQTTFQSLLLEEVTLSSKNIFRRMNGLSSVNRLLNISRTFIGILSKEDLEFVGHITSTRQMPYMGYQTEVKSIEKYKSILTNDEEPSDEHINNMYLAARRVGHQCAVHKGNTFVPPFVPHISVTSSGELNSSINKGGQAKSVADTIDRLLVEIPLEDRMENTIFGLAEFKAGIPIWKTLFVPHDDEQYCCDHEWRAPFTTIVDQPSGEWGLGKFLGIQILYLAWRDRKEVPSLRATCVPELGNKARMVTVSEYWLNILQSPLSHTLKEFLRKHPFCESSFSRGDQAWWALKLFGNHPLQPGEMVLSSDLTSATDTISFKVARAILNGFIEGAGFTVDRQYTQSVVDLIGPRCIELPDGDVFITKRGVMMGEAIAKPILTIYGLVVEEIAYLRTLGCMNLLSGYSLVESPWPRRFHLGGDDHLAAGPESYLDNITGDHQRSKSIISGDKHAKSRVAVKYCERIIDCNNFAFNSRNYDYRTSPIVDTIKIRLLTKGQSTLLAKDQKNVAVGKSKQLTKTLNWLPSETYSLERIQSIQALFIERMHGLVPSPVNDPPGFHSICLPGILGGYDLGLERLLEHHLQNSCYLIQCVANAIYLGHSPIQSLKALRRLNRNISQRAIEDLQEYGEEIEAHFTEYPSISGALSRHEVIAMYPHEDYKESLNIAKSNGWIPVKDFSTTVTRGTMFQQLLNPNQVRKLFQTRRWRDEYRSIRKILAEEVKQYGIPDYNTFEIVDFKRLLKGLGKEYYVNTRVETTFNFGEDAEDAFDFRDMNLLEGFQVGRPTLRCPNSRLGFNHF